MRDDRSEYERLEALMKVRPVEPQAKAHYPFGDMATLIVSGVYDKEEITERRRAILKHKHGRAPRGKRVTKRMMHNWPRPRKVTNEEYARLASEQDSRNEIKRTEVMR